MDIILASTSPYRRRLLERLHIPFRCLPPGTDESPLPGEPPGELAARLAAAKARSIAALHPDALVIGSDQVASLDDHIMGKPGDLSTARAQLGASSGRQVAFHTGVTLCSGARGIEHTHVERFNVLFRDLQASQIDYYLALEQPYDCAGSFKVEGLGIALFESLTGRDPTSLEGLPLIALSGMLRAVGVDALLEK